MIVTDILALVTAFFQFPKSLIEFAKLLKKTPQERHEEILKRIEEEAKGFQDTGRPTW